MKALDEIYKIYTLLHSTIIIFRVGRETTRQDKLFYACKKRTNLHQFKQLGKL